jgi:BON domain-containing protein
MTHHRRSHGHARDFEGRPDLDRSWTRPGPDYEWSGSEGGFSRPSSYPYANIASEARRGRFVGRGPKGYRRSDERIREEISDRLMIHPDIDASDVEVAVAGGIVTLTGTTEDRHEKRLAEYLVESVAGVDDVENHLKVRRGFWSALTGERTADRDVTTRAERDVGSASKEGSRAESARSSARRDAEAR